MRQRLGAAVGWAVLAACSVGAAGQPTSTQKATAGQGQFASLAARATAAREAERLDEAAALYRRALKLNPGWTEGWWSLGTIDYDADRYAEAALELGKLAHLDPKQGTARAMLGLCQFRLGDEKKALENIQEARRLGIAEDDELRQVVVYHEGLLLQRAGRFEGSSEALGSLCQTGTAADQVTRTLGMVALRMRDAEAPVAGEAAEVVAHIGRGACLAARKNYDEARREYALVERNAPHFPWLHYAYGRLLEEARDTAGAIAEYKLEIAEQPAAVLPRLRIGSAEYKQDSAAGLPYAEEALRLEPDLPFAHYLLGLLQLDTGAYAEAIPHLEAARKAFPTEARIALSLGAAYAHAGKAEDAARERKAFQTMSAAEQRAEGSGDGSPAESQGLAIGDGMTPVTPARKQ